MKERQSYILLRKISVCKVFAVNLFVFLTLLKTTKGDTPINTDIYQEGETTVMSEEKLNEKSTDANINTGNETSSDTRINVTAEKEIVVDRALKVESEKDDKVDSISQETLKVENRNDPGQQQNDNHEGKPDDKDTPSEANDAISDLGLLGKKDLTLLSRQRKMDSFKIIQKGQQTLINVLFNNEEERFGIYGNVFCTFLLF